MKQQRFNVEPMLLKTRVEVDVVTLRFDFQHPTWYVIHHLTLSISAIIDKTQQHLVETKRPFEEVKEATKRFNVTTRTSKI